MASVHDWRFKLAEEEDKRRRKFGWDDLFDLLNTAAGIYTGVQGMKQAGRAQDLAQAKQDFNVQKEGMTATEAGRIGTWGKLDPSYQGPPTAQQQEVGGPMGRMQFSQTGTAQEEGLRQERVGMLREGWQPDIQGPLPEHYQRGEGYMRNPLADVEAERSFYEANPPVYDPSQPFTLTSSGDVATPGFVSQGERDLAGIRATGSAGGYDPGDALKIEAMTEAEMSRRYPDAQRDMDGGLVYTPEMQAERAQVMDGYKAQFGYAAAELEDDPSYGAVYMEMAADFNSQDPAIRARAEAEWPEFQQGDPAGAAIVTLLRQNPGAVQAAPDANDYATLGFESEPTLGMVEAALEQAGQGLYRQQTAEGLGWSDPEKKTTHDALTELLRRLRAAAYAKQQSSAPMRPPVMPLFDRQD